MNIISDEIAEKAAVADDLVRAEREACAKICDDEDQAIASAGSYNNWAMREDALKEAASTIRALTTKDRT